MIANKLYIFIICKNVFYRFDYQVVIHDLCKKSTIQGIFVSKPLKKVRFSNLTTGQK